MTVTELMVELQRLAQQGEGGRRVIVLGESSLARPQSEDLSIVLSKTGFITYIMGKPTTPR